MTKYFNRLQRKPVTDISRRLLIASVEISEDGATVFFSASASWVLYYFVNHPKYGVTSQFGELRLTSLRIFYLGKGYRKQALFINQKYRLGAIIHFSWPLKTTCHRPNF